MKTFLQLLLILALGYICVKWTIELIKDIKKKKAEKKAKIEEMENVVSESEIASDVDKKSK